MNSCTLNSIAAGYANSYPLCLIASAIGNQIPIFIAPAMNKNLWSHPIISETIKKIENWNCRVIWPEITEKKITMINIGKILDTVYFHFCRINFTSKKDKSTDKTNKLRLLRNKYFNDFYEIGEFLKKHDLNLPTAGCLSIKVNDGFIITSSGSDLPYLRDDEISLITSWNERNNQIKWVGDKIPSSESPLHCIVHRHNKDKFVLHIHSPKMTYSDRLFEYRSKKYFRYGTFNIGYEAQKLLDKNKFCILKAHGEIIISNTLSEIKQILLKFNKFI